MNYKPGMKAEYRAWDQRWIECKILSAQPSGRWKIRIKGGARWSCSEDDLRPRSPLIELAEAAE